MEFQTNTNRSYCLLIIIIVQECQSYSQFHKHVHNFWSQTLPHNFEPFLILLEAYRYKGPKLSFIFQDWTQHLLISCFFHILGGGGGGGAGEKSSSQETKGSVSFSTNIADMRIPSKIRCNWYTKVFDIINI